VILNPNPCDLALLCKEVMENFRFETDKHIFKLNSSCQAMVLVDRFAALQILENLLSNAVKYSPGGGEILLTISRHECHCCCTIKDHGIGMTSAQVERVFDKFYRADASNTAVSGTGLGMTIVKHLVDAHNGKIGIESTFGEGTIVSVCFPCADQ